MGYDEAIAAGENQTDQRGGESARPGGGGGECNFALTSERPGATPVSPLLLAQIRLGWREFKTAQAIRLAQRQRLVGFVADNLVAGDDKEARTKAALALIDRLERLWKSRLKAAAAAQPAGQLRHAADRWDVQAQALLETEIALESQAGDEAGDIIDPALVAVACRSILPQIAAARPLIRAEDAIVKYLNGLVATLPVAAWWVAAVQRDFGTLAFIIGEAGDLSNYPTPGHLQGRLSLAPRGGSPGKALPGQAPMDQALMGRTWKIPSWRPHALSAAEWTAAGYSGAKRSILFQWAESTIKGRLPLRRYYDDAKVRLQAKNADGGFAARAADLVAAAAREGKPGNPHNAAGMLSPAHIHAMARVKMETQLLRQLWRAWRRASPGGDGGGETCGACKGESAAAPAASADPAISSRGMS